jgi:hypothetical protein
MKEWKSKLIDLLIVIIGITIAFQLNTWNVSNKSAKEVQGYLISFEEETKANQSSLTESIEFLRASKSDVDSLLILLQLKNYDDDRISLSIARMMSIENFSPSITTMENIKASGKFDQIGNIDLRKQLIETYASYANTVMFDQVTMAYTHDFTTPFFFDNIRFSDLSSLNDNFLADPEFENIVIGYLTLLTQQIKGHEGSLEEVNTLLENLTQSGK